MKCVSTFLYKMCHRYARKWIFEAQCETFEWLEYFADPVLENKSICLHQYLGMRDSPTSVRLWLQL